MEQKIVQNIRIYHAISVSAPIKTKKDSNHLSNHHF
jgi:hypothetical protein